MWTVVFDGKYVLNKTFSSIDAARAYVYNETGNDKVVRNIRYSIIPVKPDGGPQRVSQARKLALELQRIDQSEREAETRRAVQDFWVKFLPLAREVVAKKGTKCDVTVQEAHCFAIMQDLKSEEFRVCESWDPSAELRLFISWEHLKLGTE